MNAVKRHDKPVIQKSLRRKSFFTGLTLLCWTILAATAGQAILATPVSMSDTGTIKGAVLAAAPQSPAATDAAAAGIAGAKLTLINKAVPNQPRTIISNDSGEFIFENLPAGDYVLTTEASGLSTITKEITLTSGATLSLEIDLTPAMSETVTVRDEEGLLSTSNTTTSNIVHTETLKDQPLRSDNFQSAVQLTPGAIRDGNGNTYLKGTRTGQSSYTVNGVDATDPVTGNLAFDIPLEAAQSVQIEENPYSAEFGKFTGGVTNLQTKGGTDKFKFSAARFFPTFHNVFSSQIDSFRPRVTFSGPLVQKKLYFLQSFEYRFSRIFVPSQRKPNDNVEQEGFNSFTQLDWNINKSNVLKFSAAIFPNRFRNLGLDTFNPAPVTPNYKQRGTLFSVSEQSVFGDASFLSSEISYKTFDVNIFGKSNQPLVITPEVNQGSYFANTNRRTNRWQWQETYYSRPLKFHGDHSIKIGFEADRTQIAGQLRYNSIFIRRLDGTLAQRIDFRPAAPLNYKYVETSLFLQDKWVLNPRLTVDYGLRYDRDGVTKSNNFSPRFSFLYLPFNNSQTVVRGGIGIFYDRSPANAGYFNDLGLDLAEDAELANPGAEFDRVPRRVVRTYAANGVTLIDGGARFFSNKIISTLRTPRNVRYSLQVDHGFTKNLTMRVGFLERFTDNDLLVEPVRGSGWMNMLRLSSTGRGRYDELQSVLTYNNPIFGQWNASYVFSRARGDLNTASSYLDDTPSFVIRPNEYGRLPFDAPHRFLLYGQLKVSEKYDINVAPIFEVRSGFAFSAINERLEFVGKRNAAGNFPTYLSLDIQVTKGFKLPFFDTKRARIGLVVLNSTNHFNPRDVQTNLTSPNYGKFYNSLGTAVKAKFDIEF